MLCQEAVPDCHHVRRERNLAKTEANSGQLIASRGAGSSIIEMLEVIPKKCLQEFGGVCDAE